MGTRFIGTRPLLHLDDFDGRVDVCGAEDDADDGDRSLAAANDGDHAADVRGNVFVYSCVERADPLYFYAADCGSGTTMAFE